jgi:HlyD family secretion protein
LSEARKKLPLIIFGTVALALAGYWGIPKILDLTAKKSTADSVSVSGRIEGYETNLGAKIGGRVDFVAHREGEDVKLGETLAQISDDDVQAQLASAKAKRLKAKEMASDAEYQIGVVQSQIDEARLRLTQSSEDMQAQIDQGEANVAQAQARLSEAEAQLKQAGSDLQLARVRKTRYSFLASKGAVTTDELDQALSTCDSQEALVKSRESAVEAAKKQLHVTQASLEQARSTRLNPGMRRAQIKVLEAQLVQSQYKLKSAQAEVESAKGDEDAILANIAYLKVVSPINGVVSARAVEPGAVVIPGQTLLSLLDLNTVYLRGYIPEGEIGKVHVGQNANVYLDAFPGKPFAGKVIQIDPEGSFTPENIYFKEDRVKQVFGIKISINEPQRLAKPGMPADAQIKLETQAIQ